MVLNAGRNADSASQNYGIVGGVGGKKIAYIKKYQ
jgi:hypothetical protein